MKIWSINPSDYSKVVREIYQNLSTAKGVVDSRKGNSNWRAFFSLTTNNKVIVEYREVLSIKERLFAPHTHYDETLYLGAYDGEAQAFTKYSLCMRIQSPEKMAEFIAEELQKNPYQIVYTDDELAEFNRRKKELDEKLFSFRCWCADQFLK